MQNYNIVGISGAINAILDDYDKGRDIDKLDIFQQPDKKEIASITDILVQLIYPGFYRNDKIRFYDIKNKLRVSMEDVIFRLTQQIAIALGFRTDSAGCDRDSLMPEAEALVLEFFKRIPYVRECADTDLQAGYEGDPAASCKEEVVCSYPGLFAITVSRLAHELFLLNVPLIPRIMTEYAHGLTGIDIHPGATIGRYFFIDHGTGIVVGETTTIGEHVKIYQGVTLGALSTRGGQKLRSRKRHPTIEDNVTIYAGASVLGGETVIGEGAVIGSNVFITTSIEPGARVSIKSQELVIHPKRMDQADAANVEEGAAEFREIQDSNIVIKK